MDRSAALSDAPESTFRSPTHLRFPTSHRFALPYRHRLQLSQTAPVEASHPLRILSSVRAREVAQRWEVQMLAFAAQALELRPAACAYRNGWDTSRLAGL